MADESCEQENGEVAFDSNRRFKHRGILLTTRTHKQTLSEVASVADNQAQVEQHVSLSFSSFL